MPLTPDPGMTKLSHETLVQPVTELFNRWALRVKNDWLIIVRNLAFGLRIAEFSSKEKAMSDQLQFERPIRFNLLTFVAYYSDSKFLP